MLLDIFDRKISGKLWLFGELVKKYKLDVDVSCICVDGKNKIIYAIANNPDPQIVKFILK